MNKKLIEFEEFTKTLEINIKQKMEYNWKLLYAIDDMLYQRNTLFTILNDIAALSKTYD